MLTPRLAMTAAMLVAGGASGIAEEHLQIGPYMCKGIVKAAGTTRPSKSLAELTAIRSWIEIVKRDDKEDYAWWHRAQDKKLTCDAVSRGRYHRCAIEARPCVPAAGADAPQHGESDRNGSS